MKWFRKAADQGNPRAQHNLGFMYAYANGESVLNDLAEAVKWYRKAADQGFAPSQYTLGLFYRNGTGVPQNNAEAVKWYRKAADQGYRDAQFNLATMYATARLCAGAHVAQFGWPISTYGPGMARWSASITRSMWRYVSGQDGRQARPRRSSTARAPRARKKGALLDPQGFDAGKKITGRKRHILVDTLGLLLSVAVHPANIQDRDGLALVLDCRTRRFFPFIERIYGDGGYQGPKAAKAAAKTCYWTIEIVERTFAWLSRFRRLARDIERYARTVAAFIHLAMIRIMLRRLAAAFQS